MKLLIVCLLFIALDVAQARTTAVDNVLQSLNRGLQRVKDKSVRDKQKYSGRRNHLAAKAATNNYEDSKKLLLSDDHKLLERLMNRYVHTEYWEKQFNEWGGWDNDYAANCHGIAKIYYFHALEELKKLGKTVESVQPRLVSLFTSIHPRPGSTFEVKLRAKSGYSRGHAVDRDLHTRIATEIRASMNNAVSSVEGGISAEVAASLRSSTTIENQGEREIKKSLFVDLSLPTYIYQTMYVTKLGNGSSLDAWSVSAWTISNEPIDIAP